MGMSARTSSTACSRSGIPTLVVIDAKTGNVISNAGRAKVDSDPEGAEFPWHPKPLNELDGECVEYINDTPVVVAFDSSEAVKAAMEPLAAAWVAADKEKGETTMMWLWAGGPCAPGVQDSSIVQAGCT